jgi:hypothetical protein
MVVRMRTSLVYRFAAEIERAGARWKPYAARFVLRASDDVRAPLYCTFEMLHREVHLQVPKRLVRTKHRRATIADSLRRVGYSVEDSWSGGLDARRAIRNVRELETEARLLADVVARRLTLEDLPPRAVRARAKPSRPFVPALFASAKRLRGWALAWFAVHRRARGRFVSNATALAWCYAVADIEETILDTGVQLFDLGSRAKNVVENARRELDAALAGRRYPAAQIAGGTKGPPWVMTDKRSRSLTSLAKERAFIDAAIFGDSRAR